MWRFFFYYPVSGNCFPLTGKRNWRNEQMVWTFLTFHSERKKRLFQGEIHNFGPEYFQWLWARAPPRMTEKSLCFFFGYFVILIQLFAICFTPTNALQLAIFLFSHLLPFVVWIYHCLRLSFLSRLLWKYFLEHA